MTTLHETLTVRVTRSERGAIQRAAAQRGLRVGTYLRHLARCHANGIDPTFPAPEVPVRETTGAQAKIGTALARAYGHVQEVLAEARGLCLPRDALWGGYRERVPNATRKSFSTLIDKLIVKGLLVQRFEGDQPFLTLPRTPEPLVDTIPADVRDAILG